MAKQAKVKPTYLKGKPLKIALHDVMRVLKMIDDHKHTKKFEKAAKRKKAFVKVDSKTVNFVKDYLVKNNMHAHPIGKHVVNARGLVNASGLRARGDRFDCNFG